MRVPLSGVVDDQVSTAIQFQDGDHLVRRGDPADHVLVIVAGSAKVISADEVELAVLGPGHLVGEVSILAGGARTADVVAVGPVTARRFDRAQFIRYMDSRPELTGDVTNEIARRLDEHQISAFVTRLLGPGLQIPFAELRRHLAWRWITGGQALFRAGDPAESGFLVISGRLRVVVQDEDGERTLGEIGPDEFVGEGGIFEGRPRGVTVEAIRDTLVAEVSRQAAIELLRTHPESVGPLMSTLVRRARRGISTRARRTVAVTVTADLDARGFLDALHRAMGGASRCAHVWADWVDERLSQPGASNAGPGDATEPRLTRLLHELELSHEHMLLDVGRTWSGWSETAARQGDRLVGFVSASADDEEVRMVDRLFQAGPAHAERILVVIHPPATDRPRHTATLVERWRIDRVTHVVEDSVDDIARLGRLLTGRSYGLVFGGGGARGFAHAGVRRAMLELGIPIDIVGGTSMGSSMALGAAMKLPQDEYVDMIERLFRGLLDYTIPVVSLVKGEAITAAIEKACGGWDFEDLWLPFFAVSTNLTKSIEVVHRRGDLVHAIRASTSIPGVMPPVPFGDDLLVDGGVLNNLPADIMRKDVEEGTVIAVDVAPPVGPRAKGDMALSVSGWEALRSRGNRGKASYPGITAMLMRTMIAGSMREREKVIARGDADLHLDLDLRGISLLDFENVRPVVAAGYEAAMPRLEAWLESRREDT
ncbi:MAG TPA: cyclic nucleotide-binding domain-containing protein [Acidimicrobiia bacterium]|nr:cyclic nucleotide-binding domain-containing protein [Acidimicrobiia bacterium]